MREEGAEREQRWDRTADLAGRYAANERLLLARDWTADFVLEVTGQVVVVDTEYGKPETPATEREARGALFRAIEIFPELLSLLPGRPEDAVECPTCNGTGVVEVALANPKFRNIICQCSGAGWLRTSDPGATT